MKRNACRVLGLLGIMVLVVVSACSQQESPVGRDGGTVRPSFSSIDLDRLAARSQAQGKNVYLEFATPWCHFCRKFQTEVLSTSQSQRALQNVIFVQANFDREKPLARQFGVKAIPTGLLLKSQNGRLQVIDRHTGGLSQEKFVQFISR